MISDHDKSIGFFLHYRQLACLLGACTLLCLQACGSDGADSTAANQASTDASAGSVDDASGEAAEVGSQQSCEAEAAIMDTQRLTIDGTTFRDALGRQVLLRGVNTGGRSKFAPFIPFPFGESGLENQEGAPPFEEAAADFFARVADWGHDVIRLPFSWEALEPTPGAYDDTYLDRYMGMIAAAGVHGIRVVVDFHQDVFASPYCGDGFPPWACPEPVPEQPDQCKDWFTAYLQAESPVKTAFDRFWNNEDGLMDAFKAMWTHMAEAAWAYDNVIGFEIINEPHAGYQEEAEWATEVLVSFYEDLSATVRQIAPESLVFFDSTGLDAALQTTAMTRPDGSEFAFAPHFYHMSIFLGGEIDPGTVGEGVGQWAAKGIEWDLPVLVGEFGIQRSSEVASAYLTAVMDALDANQMHGTA